MCTQEEDNAVLVQPIPGTRFAIPALVPAAGEIYEPAFASRACTGGVVDQYASKLVTPVKGITRNNGDQLQNRSCRMWPCTMCSMTACSSYRRVMVKTEIRQGKLEQLKQQAEFTNKHEPQDCVSLVGDL